MTHRVAGLFSICAAALNTACGPACAAEVPIRQPGQWQLTAVSETVGMRTIKTCIAATDDVVTGENSKNCGPADAEKIADETFVNVTCAAGKSHQKISTLLTGDFTSWYRAVTKITLDPPQDGVSHLGVIVDGKYLGPSCDAGTSGITKQQE